MWLKELKIALIEEDVEKMDILLDNLPDLQQPKEIETALYLIKQASTLVENFRDETFVSMTQMQKSINFLKSTQAPNINKFDILL